MAFDRRESMVRMTANPQVLVKNIDKDSYSQEFEITELNKLINAPHLIFHKSFVPFYIYQKPNER